MRSGKARTVSPALALHAGIEMSPTRLFALDGRRRVFGVPRFDRRGDERVHLHSVGGLLHASHPLPSLDDQTILAAKLPASVDTTMKRVTARRGAVR